MNHRISAWRASNPSRGMLSLALILVVLLGGGLNLLGHHDHSPASSHADCAACRVLETPVEAAPLQAEAPAVDSPRVEARWMPAAPALPADPALSLDRPRGPPRA